MLSRITVFIWDFPPDRGNRKKRRPAGVPKIKKKFQTRKPTNAFARKRLQRSEFGQRRDDASIATKQSVKTKNVNAINSNVEIRSAEAMTNILVIISIVTCFITTRYPWNNERKLRREGKQKNKKYIKPGYVPNACRRREFGAVNVVSG